ncbi:MAG: 6-hydroxymethylpterin diphosphokinase MptE-like protein [Vicinamibacterales bacterium]
MNAASTATAPASGSAASCVDSATVRATTLPSGRLDVSVRPPSGNWIRLQSLHDPEAEARALVDRALGERHVPPVVALIGVGLGYVVDELLRRRADVRVVALEVLPDLLRLWQSRCDLTPLLSSGQLAIGVDPAFELPTAGWPASAIVDDALVIVPPMIAHHWAPAVERARRAVNQFMFERRANEEARQRLAPMYLEHTLRNLPAIARSADVSALDGVAGGDPLVLCGAGPSLDRLLPELRAGRDRAWYVALDTSVRPLLSAGIVPDLVVSIDPTPMNGRHLLNLRTRRRPWLVAETSLDPSAMTGFHGRTFACRVNRTDPWPWLETLDVAPTVVRAWGSVLTTACDVIMRMGPSRVAFAGIDLAFTNGQPYCRGTAFEEDWEAQRQRDGLHTIEDVWKARLQGHTIEEPDVNGQPTRTAGHMIAFRNWARSFVASSAASSHEPDGREWQRADQAARRGLRETPPNCEFANVTRAGILHGDGIEQCDLTSWLLRSQPLTVDPEVTLQAVASPRWLGQAARVSDAAQSLLAADPEPWVGWDARVPRLDRAALGRVIQYSARRLRALERDADMQATQSDWIDVPFDASNFYAQSETKWAVRESDVATYAYRVDGKTMTLSFKINYSSILGPPTRELFLRLPAGYRVNRGAANAVWMASQPMKEMGYVTVHPGGDVAVVHRVSEAPFPTEDGCFFLFGQLVLEVQ